MRRRVWLGVVLLVVVPPALGAREQDGPTVEQLLAKLDAYFETYHEELGRFVAEERLVQQAGGPSSAEEVRGRSSGVNALRITQDIRSDVAFVDLPGAAGWLGFRDVLTVNGRQVRPPGPSLAEALLKGGAEDYQQARALLLASARHNLGDPRTTNLPTVPLEYLQQRHRWRYDVRVEGYERVEGHRTAMVRLQEGSTPTLARRGDGGDLMARVVGWIEPDSGRLWRAEVRFEDPRIIFAERHRPTTLRVHFKMHASLGIVLPDRMEESFFDSVRGSGTSDARYRNFRRFETTARVVPPVR
jgi:hypothetical protein